MLVNPVLFPQPEDDTAWSTRAMLGEELWIAERPKDRALAIQITGGAALLAALSSARRRRLAPAIAATSASMGLTMAYWKLMADYYEAARPTPRSEPMERSCGCRASV